MAQNMTKGNPTKLLVEFMIPVLIGNLFQNLYGIVDSMVVGRYLGVDALAAVGSVGIVTFGVQGLAIGMTSGFGIIFSQCYGGQKESELRHHIAVAAYVSVMFSVLMTGILLGYLPLLLELMNIPQEIYGETELYTRIFFWGFGACVAYNFFSAAARAVGDSRTPLYFLIFSSVLNVILDIVLIRDFGMGVDGAAVATVASQLLSGILCGIYVFAAVFHAAGSEGRVGVSCEKCRNILKMGVPMALQFFITALGGMILQSHPEQAWGGSDSGIRGGAESRTGDSTAGSCDRNSPCYLCGAEHRSGRDRKNTAGRPESDHDDHPDFWRFDDCVFLCRRVYRLIVFIGTESRCADVFEHVFSYSDFVFYSAGTYLCIQKCAAGIGRRCVSHAWGRL